MHKMFRVTLAGVLLAVTVGAAFAAYPEKAVTVIVPFPPGGSTDVIARSLAADLQKQFAQPFVVENRAGATGTIGATQVKRAAPDGYTLFVSSLGPFVIVPHLMKDLPVRPRQGFRPPHGRGAGPQRACGADSVAVQIGGRRDRRR